jgi:hypothetical protein
LLGQLLQQDPFIIDAVEPHPVWAAHARPYYRTVYTDGIETAALPARSYQVVVCADVLEHTVDPTAVLRKLQRAALPDAAFIISLPNVAHIAARLLLLSGRFPQMDRGIFDRTHLHFYTRAGARELAERAEYDVEREAFAPGMLPGEPLVRRLAGGTEEAPLALVGRLRRAAAARRPELFALQVVLTLAPRS